MDPVGSNKGGGGMGRVWGVPGGWVSSIRVLLGLYKGPAIMGILWGLKLYIKALIHGLLT